VSAKHALLGLLLHRPTYGYELGNRLQQRLGSAWEINSGQLYRALEELAKEGLIEPVGPAPGGRDDRRFFAITMAGVQEFERWFDADNTRWTRLQRRPLLVKIMLAGPERLGRALEHIAAYEQECAARLKELSRELEEIPPGGAPVRADHELLRCSLSADVSSVEGELRWARYMHERIAWLKTQDAIWPAVREPAELAKRARDRHDARRELFGRMAERRQGPARGKPKRNRDG
jgi:DNA-binding PadR family transcriptional regulator